MALFSDQERKQYSAYTAPQVTVPAKPKSIFGKIWGGAGNVLGAVGNVLSRGNWASANAAKYYTNNQQKYYKPTNTGNFTLDVIGNVAQQLNPITWAKVAADKDLWKAAYEGASGKKQTTYSNVIGQVTDNKIAKGVGGFAMDVALDPTTWLTMGTGSGAKIATKEGTQVLTQKGSLKFAKVLQNTKTREAAEKAMGKIIQNSPELVDKGGIKFAGKMIPGTNKVTAPFSQVASALSNKIGKYAGLKKNLTEVRTFQKYSDLADAAKYKYGRNYDKMFLGSTNTERKLIADAIETGDKTVIANRKLAGGYTIHGVIDQARKDLKKMGELEMKRGFYDQMRENYIYHMVKDPKTRQMLMANVKNVSPKKGFSKTRQVENLLADLPEGVYEKDALKILKARAYSHIDAVNRHDLLSDVAKKFGTSKEIRKAYKEPSVGAKEVWKSKMVPNQKMLTDTGEALVSIPGVKELSDVKLPSHIASYVTNMDTKLLNLPSTNRFLRGYDKALNFWKGSVTSLFPSFHVRNAMSNVFQNYLDVGLAHSLDPRLNTYAAKLAGATWTSGDTIKLAGKKWKMGELYDVMQKNGVLQGIGYFDVKSPVKYLPKTLKIGGKRKLLPINVGRTAGRGIENQSRALNFIANMEMNGGNVLDAAEHTKKFLFDYEDLSKTEREVFKRVFPFWTWTSKNMVLISEQLIKKPGKFANVYKLQNSLSQPLTPEEQAAIPSYDKNKLRIKTGSNNGVMKSIQGFGTPLEAWSDVLANPLQQGGSMLSPALKVPIEATTKTDLFTGRPIKDMTSGKGMNLPIIRDLAGYSKREQTINGRKKTKETITNPWVAWALRQLPTSRAQSTLGNVTDENQTPGARTLQFLTGVKKASTDVESAKYFQNQDNLKSWADPLVKKGVLRESQYGGGYYIPNNVSMTQKEHDEAQAIIDMYKATKNKSSKTSTPGITPSGVEGQSFYDSSSKKDKTFQPQTQMLLNLASNPKLSPEQRQFFMDMASWAETNKKPSSLKKKKSTSKYSKVTKTKRAKVKLAKFKAPKVGKVKLKIG